MPRGANTKDLLRMHWDYPVYTPPPAPSSGGTAPAAVRRALSREEALRAVAGTDPRPLLVLRECPVCNKTDDALLKGGPENDRTLVLAQWFHCVKLPVDVVEPGHPFHALFPNDDAEHLFLALADGAAKQPLESDGSRAELWSSMSQVLGLAYEKNPAPGFADVLKRFGVLDVLESKVLDVEARQGLEMENARPDKKKVEEFEREIAALKAQIVAERAAIEKVLALAPKAKPVGPAAGPAQAAR